MEAKIDNLPCQPSSGLNNNVDYDSFHRLNTVEELIVFKEKVAAETDFRKQIVGILFLTFSSLLIIIYFLLILFY
jgi:hypothetical protein